MAASEVVRHPYAPNFQAFPFVYFLLLLLYPKLLEQSVSEITAARYVCVNRSDITICSYKSTKRDFTLIIFDVPTALSGVLTQWF